MFDRFNHRLDAEAFSVPCARPCGLRILVVSDLHIRRPEPFHAQILDRARALAPDLILIPGDSTDSCTENIPGCGAFFGPLARIAPCVAILGNNDCLPAHAEAVRMMYRESRVTLLEDETLPLVLRGGSVRVTGLLDPAAFVYKITDLPEDDDPRAERLRRAMRETDTPSILLLHRPHLAAQYAEAKPTLIVAGHAHGGQFRLPGGQGLYAPGQGVLPRLTSGLYDAGAPLLVSRGLGNHTFPLRLNNRPHLPLITFTTRVSPR